MSQPRRAQGQISHHAGQAAEQQMIGHYQRHGCILLSQRWRGTSGEIDIVFDHDGEVIFVEVKKSSDFSRAAYRLSQRQMQRIYTAAAEFLAQMPQGSLTPARFDVALLDAAGAIEIIENAFDMA